MSHFTKVETKITELLFLKKAISDMDLEYEEGKLKAKGWLWKKAKADIIIPTKSGYDIGFQFNGKSYDVVADWDSIGDIFFGEFTLVVVESGEHGIKNNLFNLGATVLIGSG